MAALLEFLQEYVEQLSELTSPVKAKINSLTMLAAEEAAATPAAAPSIAAAIEKRINTAPAGQKLPALFLLDSITKNAKEPFIQIFSRNLPEVFLAVWETCPSDRPTLQRVLTTWDRIFPPSPLEAIRRRAGLIPTLASAPPATAAAAAAPLLQPQLLPAPFVQQPPVLPAAAPAMQSGPAAAIAAPQPVPMQRDPASLRPDYGQQGQNTVTQPQQLSTPVTLPAPQPQPQPQSQLGPQKLGPNQIAALREAAVARLAAVQAPKPKQQQLQPRGQPRGQHHQQQQQQQQQQQRPAVLQQAGRGPASAATRSREYEPTMPVATGSNALRPEQLSQLEALLKSLAQGGVATAQSATPQAPSAPSPSLEELWSPAKLKARNPAAVKALLDASAALLPLQLDRAFAARRRVRARGAAAASRSWFPSPAAWLAGAAPEADPGAAFGQQEDAEEEKLEVHSVAADDSQTQCALSGEKFETFWDDEMQQWRYRDAKRLDATEAARCGLAEGAIVLVSALSALDAQPGATADVANGNANASAAIAEAMQGSKAPTDMADSLAAATEDAAAPAPDVLAPALLPEAAAADVAQHAAAVKPEPEGDQEQPGGVMAGDSAEAVTELAPAAIRAAAAGSPQPEVQHEAQQQNGVAGSADGTADGSAEQVQVGSKRPLEGGAASEGPPVKIKREAV